MTERDGIRTGVVRGISYGLLTKPEAFGPAVDELGAGLVRVFLYWSQFEPRPGEYDWTAVDAMLAQAGDAELWVMVGAASPWGSSRATDFLPSSPPVDPAAYRRAVGALVAHCGGRVRYWQCENEPCNALFWTGTADDYLAHLAVFSAAVREADPGAEVVLGGCPPGVFPAGEDDERTFFETVLRGGAELFDAVDIHLYGDPYQVPDAVHACRRFLADLGYERPVLAGESGGPVPIEFPELLPELGPIMQSGAMVPWERMSVADSIARRTEDTPARRAMVALYDRMAELPPALQMFMMDCPEQSEALRDRIACRDLVLRTVLALSAGVSRTACWSLGPEGDGTDDETLDRYDFLMLLFGKLALFRHDGDRVLARPLPAADTFAQLAALLAGAQRVRRVEVADRPDRYVFEVDRRGRGPALVAWDRHDALTADDAPSSALRWPWPGSAVSAVSALGAAVPVRVAGGELHTEVSATPVLIG